MQSACIRKHPVYLQIIRKFCGYFADKSASSNMDYSAAGAYTYLRLRGAHPSPLATFW